MNLIKTSFLSAIASVFKIAFGFLLTKLLAVYGGTSDVAILGQVQNAFKITSGVASAGFENGLIKHIAEHKGGGEKIRPITATAFRMVSIFVTIIIAIGLLFSNEFSEMALGDANDDYFSWILIALPAAAMGMLLQAVLNGYREVRKLVAVGIGASIVSSLLALWLVPNFGLYGAIAAFLIGPVSTCLLSIYSLSTVNHFSFRLLWGKVDRECAGKLSKFTAMAIASAVFVPVALIFVRAYLADQISWDAAGIWTGMWRISEGYLMLITMTLTVYYLPRLAEIKNQTELKKEILYGQKIILPLVALLALIIYLFKDQVILILFDDSFNSMSELFAAQFTGDIIRVAAWLYGYVIFAKADVYAHVCIEMLLTLTFVLLAVMMIDLFGLAGISYAFAINSLINFVVVYGYFRIQCKRDVYEGVVE